MNDYELSRYDDIVEASANASAEVRRLERELFKTTPGSTEGRKLYTELQAAEIHETEMRKRVRNHPDHSYEGL